MSRRTGRFVYLLGISRSAPQVLEGDKEYLGDSKREKLCRGLFEALIATSPSAIEGGREEKEEKEEKEYVLGWNSGLRSLSASSITIILHLLRFAMPLSARSCTLPGVPTNMCIGACSLIMSSLRTVPPVVTIAPTFICFAISITIADVCNANSRVGTRISAGRYDSSWRRWM